MKKQSNARVGQLIDMPPDALEHIIRNMKCVDVRHMCVAMPGACNENLFKSLVRNVVPSLTWKHLYNYICYRSLVHVRISLGPYEGNIFCDLSLRLRSGGCSDIGIRIPAVVGLQLLCSLFQIPRG